MLKLFEFHMNSIHFSQRKPLRHDKSVTDEQKDHNALFYLIALVGIKSNGGAEKHVCKHTVLNFSHVTNLNKLVEVSMETLEEIFRS